MSIKARLLIAISVLVVAALVVIGVVTVTVTRARMIARVDDSLVTAAANPASFAGHSQEAGTLGPVKRATATMILGSDGTVRLAEPSGFADNPDPLPAVRPSDLTARSGKLFTTGAADGSGRRFRVLPRSLGDGQYLVIAAPLDDVDATIRSLTTVIAATGIVVLAAVILVVWLTIRRGLRPIDAMIATAGLIAAGDLSHRVEHDDTATEVGQLGQALNAMLARIEASFAAKDASERRLRRFVADASHELRTPLTSIRGYAELYRSGAAATPAGLERVMARIESEGARMGVLVEDLLLLARLDQGRPLRREPVDLVRVVDDAVSDARVVEPARLIAFEHPATAQVLGDADRLRQVVDNLLANARVHTEPDTSVRVGIEACQTDVVITIADDGPGMAPDDAARVFDRFYRADASRSRARGGVGLGLSIVAAIVEAHAGRVTLDTAPGCGAAFAVALPSAEPARQSPEFMPAAAITAEL